MERAVVTVAELPGSAELGRYGEPAEPHRRAGERETAPTPEGRRRSSVDAVRRQSVATFLASADLRFAAWFLWMTPLLTALSSLREATCSAAAAASASPDSVAARTARIERLELALDRLVALVPARVGADALDLGLDVGHSRELQDSFGGIRARGVRAGTSAGDGSRSGYQRAAEALQNARRESGRCTRQTTRSCVIRSDGGQLRARSASSADRLGELRLVERGVGARRGQQLGVGALLDDPARLHHQDQVGVADRREPVGDDEAGPVGRAARPSRAAPAPRCGCRPSWSPRRGSAATGRPGTPGRS